jgi:amino acid transporter
MTEQALLRAIGRWSLAGLVLNSIVGSGVFLLPADVYKLVGRFGPWSYLLAALGMGLIMACFAEVASQFREAGGPYLYARETFGPFAGILVGWLAWLVRLTAAAANANTFVIYLGQFWTPAGQPVTRALALTLLIGLLAAVNYRGVKAGAQFSNFFAIAKLVPLVLFVGAGLFYLQGPAAASAPVSPAPPLGSWLEAILLLVFAYGGFESALMPMAEAKDPRRDAPFALFVGLAVTAVLYTLNQIVVQGALPDAGQSARPLADAAQVFLGPAGAAIISLGALISVYGYLSSQMLNAPRLTYAFASSGDFPSPFAAVHARFRTPYISIVVYALLVWGLAVLAGFKWNAVLSAVGRLATYAAVCLAVPALRRARPQQDAFRIPAGWLCALLGVAFCVVMAARMGRDHFQIIAVLSAVAVANWLWVRRKKSAMGLNEPQSHRDTE